MIPPCDFRQSRLSEIVSLLKRNERGEEARRATIKGGETPQGETESPPITRRALANHGVVCIEMRSSGYHNSD